MNERDIPARGPIGRVFMVDPETGRIKRMFEVEDGRKLWLETDEVATPEQLDIAKLVKSLRTKAGVSDSGAEQ